MKKLLDILAILILMPFYIILFAIYACLALPFLPVIVVVWAFNRVTAEDKT